MRPKPLIATFTAILLVVSCWFEVIGLPQPGVHSDVAIELPQLGGEQGLAGMKALPVRRAARF